MIHFLATGKEMEQKGLSPPPQPHVVVFPFPAVGHVTSLLRLAQLLSLSGFDITFLNTDYIQENFFQFDDAQSLHPEGLSFKAIPDGLPLNCQRSFVAGLEIYEAMTLRTKPIFKEMMLKTKTSGRPVTCIIGDGALGFILEVALEVGIPIIQFHTHSPSSFWAFFSLPNAIEAGELSITGSEDMDRIITKVPGMETFLRIRDVPRFNGSVSLEDDPSLRVLMNEAQKFPRAQGLILNTFEDLDGPVLSLIRSRCPRIYAVGPLQEQLKTRPTSMGRRRESYMKQTFPSGLWKMDRSCLEWLEGQPPQSVVYVSFGSVALLTRDQLMEFWYGLVNSKKRFLWVRRPGSCEDGDPAEIPEELLEGTKARGKIVEWAPQEEVLAHNAIGGFLTHSGWNSTLESIAAGVPMICWPYFSDQLINSRYVGEVWKLGLDMKDVCDRLVIEKMVNDMMVERRNEFLRSATGMAELARKSMSEGGSSYRDLDRLVEDIRSMILSVEAMSSEL